MIHTEAQYRRSLLIVQEGLTALDASKTKLEKEGKPQDRIRRLLAPERAYLKDIENEIAWFENTKKQKIFSLENLATLGKTLIALRIATGMTQTELAEKLGVAQSHISRDEYNEYHGISVERAQKILAVFGAQLKSQITLGHSGSRGADGHQKAA